MMTFPFQQSRAQDKASFVDVRPSLITDTQATKLIEPGESSLRHPAPSLQATAMLSVSLGEQRDDVADMQTLPNCLRS
jgi:hypothetical protein